MEAHTAQTVLTAVASTPRPPLHLECLSSSSSFCLPAQVTASLHQMWSKKYLRTLLHTKKHNVTRLLFINLQLGKVFFIGDITNHISNHVTSLRGMESSIFVTSVYKNCTFLTVVWLKALKK